jgi:hypothetical protein
MRGPNNLVHRSWMEGCRRSASCVLRIAQPDRMLVVLALVARILLPTGRPAEAAPMSDRPQGSRGLALGAV